MSHIAEDYPIKEKKDSSEASNNDAEEAATFSVASASMTTTKLRRMERRMVYIACTHHTTNGKRLMSDFTTEKEIVHVGNEETSLSFAKGTVRARTAVGGRTY